MRIIVEEIGKKIIQSCQNTGGTAVLLVKILRRIITGDFDKKEFRRNLYTMGYKSLPIMMATAFVVGVILVIQAFVFVDKYGMRSQLGGGAGFVTIRELGPILLGLMFSGRVGAHTSAQLGTMTVTDQVDGLRCLAIDPISFLVVPRFIAMIVSLACLTMIGNWVALISASIMGHFMMNVDQHTFWSNLLMIITPWDFVLSLTKSVLFAVIIGVNSCYFGLTTKGGAPGVGISVNKAVVSSAVAIFVVDFFSTFILG